MRIDEVKPPSGIVKGEVDAEPVRRPEGECVASLSRNFFSSKERLFGYAVSTTFVEELFIAWSGHRRINKISVNCLAFRQKTGYTVKNYI